MSPQKKRTEIQKGEKAMKKKISVVILGVVMVLCLCACSAKQCSAGCGEKANPNCSAGMCDGCCRWYAGFNGCRHTEFD